jgi:hypothetical protein
MFLGLNDPRRAYLVPVTDTLFRLYGACSRGAMIARGSSA